MYMEIKRSKNSQYNIEKQKEVGGLNYHMARFTVKLQ